MKAPNHENICIDDNMLAAFSLVRQHNRLTAALYGLRPNPQQLNTKHEQQLAEADRLRRLNQWCAQKLHEMGEIDADEYASCMWTAWCCFSFGAKSGAFLCEARDQSAALLSMDLVP